MLIQELLAISEAESNKVDEHAHMRDFLNLADKEMPGSGDGDSRLTQWLVAVNKLSYKWWNDGDVYDNTGHHKGWANDISGSANWLYSYMKPEYGAVLKSVHTEHDYDKLMKQIESISNGLAKDEAFVEKLRKEPKVGDPYDEEGPFRFVDHDDDDYDESDYDEDEDEDDEE